MDSIRYYLPGIILILIAIVVVAVPEILVAFVSATIIMTGIGALYIGHTIRKSDMQCRRNDHRFMNDDFFGWRFAKRPVFRTWHRRS